MSDSLIQKLESSKEETLVIILEKFIKENSQTFLFPILDENGKREQVWKIIFSHLESSSSLSLTKTILSTLRVFSRDKTDLNLLLTRDRMLTLATCAGLIESKNETFNNEVAFEALKCLCNMLFNEQSIVKTLESFNILTAIMKRLSSDCNLISDEVKVFDIKMLFLMTSFSKVMCCQVYFDHNGVSVLTHKISFILEGLNSNDTLEKTSIKSKKEEENNIKLCCEILKTLFNVLSQKSEKDSVVHQKSVLELVGILRDLLLFELNNCPFIHNMQSDIINLLTVVPKETYQALLLPVCCASSIEFDQYEPAMKSIMKIVEFLDLALTDVEAGRSKSVETLSPVLLVLLEITNSDRIFRKHLRMVVLPNLTDVHKRPEDGMTLRNKLCRLLTSPVTSVTNLTSDWLFVLCKENVGRMVKYTGYGNSAGLFARRGFLGATQEYSSDSEDSDTEEYLKNKDMINPVLGCKVEPHTNTIENLSLEEKEYLAMDLVDKIDKLQRQGIIQPCHIGKDGRPEPIEHILELQNEFPKQIDKLTFNKNKN